MTTLSGAPSSNKKTQSNSLAACLDPAIIDKH
jgi:hypothetical protein